MSARSHRDVGERRALALALTVATVFSAGACFADNGSPTAGSQAAAQALFDDARKAMAQGNYAAACPKFADSERLDPGAGTLLNLANCYEKNGQSASAWATFKDAAAEAKKSGHPDWEATARKRAAALETTLSRLTIDVPTTTIVDGLELRRDGVVMARAEWGVPIPVDPGSHIIEASAPNARKWSTTTNVDAGGATATVSVPGLEIQAVVPPPPPPQALMEERSKGGGQRTSGLVLAGVGVAGIAVGGAFGVEAITKNNQALEPTNCPTHNLCNANGLSLTNDAKTFATVSTVGFIAGGAFLAAGAIVFFTAPKKNPEGRPTALRLAPAVAPGNYGLLLGGTW